MTKFMKNKKLKEKKATILGNTSGDYSIERSDDRYAVRA